MPPWTVACQAPLSIGFSRQEDWSGLHCPPLGDILNLGTEPVSLTYPALASRFFTTSATWEAPYHKWHPTPVLLPGKFPRLRSLIGYSPWGRKESDTTERLHFHFSQMEPQFFPGFLTACLDLGDLLLRGSLTEVHRHHPALHSNMLQLHSWISNTCLYFSLRFVWLFVTPWAVARQASLSMGFSRQEYWRGLPFPSPGDLTHPGIEPGSPTLQADSLPSEPPEKPEVYNNLTHTEQWNQSRWNWIHNLQSSVQNKNKWLFKKMSGNFKMATADH